MSVKRAVAKVKIQARNVKKQTEAERLRKINLEANKLEKELKERDKELKAVNRLRRAETRLTTLKNKKVAERRRALDRTLIKGKKTAKRVGNFLSIRLRED
jgi:hypothetical protein